MDFPIDIKGARSFVKGMTEFRQVVYLIFKNYIGSFFQSLSLGSCIPQHGAEGLLEYGVRETLKQIPGTELVSLDIEVDGSVAYITMGLQYQDNIETFTFSTEV